MLVIHYYTLVTAVTRVNGLRLCDMCLDVVAQITESWTNPIKLEHNLKKISVPNPGKVNQ